VSVNNAIYEKYGDRWWDEDATFDFTSLRYCVNPVRHGYFTRAMRQNPPPGRRLLDVGCGGGFLAESFARDGFQVTGIDPSGRSIRAAADHSASAGLAIDYRVGRGEALPFPSGAFDVVACCDVLEHVDDVGQVLGEVARTLTDGGVFLFDTVNRTWRSRFALITVWQDWGIGGLRERDVHVWENFVTPAELSRQLGACGLVVLGMRGMSPRRNPLALAWAFRQIRRGRLRTDALAPALGFRESADLGVSYMGLARKGRR
jgi:2-polyprenyl-6-hydroxyphenyl methylase/3-demethylubiquinone-9 3-methyltransferase